MDASHLLNVGLIVVIAVAIAFQTSVWYNAAGDGEDFKYITSPLTSPSDVTDASRKLVEYSKNEFSKPEVLKVTNNVYVAIGFALANSILIEGTDGLIIVDTTESAERMQEILTEFRKISRKPVKAVIVTHFHADHILGTETVLKEGKVLFPDQRIEIYSHHLTQQHMQEYSALLDISYTRAVRQFGTELTRDDNAHTGAGIGYELIMTKNITHVEPDPTVTFRDHASYTVAGVTFELFHTPGETDDQITVWLPHQKVAMPADNIYRTFPNIYAIRGSPTRSSKQWYQSLDKILNLGAEFMVPSHTRPVIGTEAVYDTLLVYRDGIKYVHDQTVRLINKGFLPDEIVEEVELPDRLRSHPFLQEHYGTVKWSVRSVFVHYLGWFSGDPVDLEPMTRGDRAIRMLALVTQSNTRGRSGVEILLQVAQKSLENSYKKYVLTRKHDLTDDKWALELANAVLEVKKLNPKLTNVAKQIKISALSALGVESISPNGRNYYLTSALEIETNVDLVRTRETKIAKIMGSSSKSVLEMLCLKVNGKLCQNVNYTIELHLDDSDENFGLTLRNSVCDVITNHDVMINIESDVSLTMTSYLWKSILVEDKDLSSQIKLGNIKLVDGSVSKFNEFTKCFDSIV